MSYMALYRKFRPQEFSEVKGQDHIVTTLKNEIAAGRIGHAYLFTGTRGTGKTTVAKIFARAVNCEHPKPDGSPCGECPTCKAIAAGSSMNVIEIDAASNNGVENIRSIIEDVEYPPAAGRYKVYIIDEVHMLSAGAFNAFLKTLEEPPSYVIFILATTELQKIPVTILSRCQRYDFHRISVETITARLRELCDREGVKASDDALSYVAKAGDGSMRDALSLLDQCINFYLGEELDYDKVLSVLGAVDTEVLSELFNAIIDRDVNHICDLIDRVMTEGRDLNTFVSDFIWYLRDMLLYQNAPELASTFDMTTENRRKLEENARKAGSQVLMRYISVLSDLTNRMRMVTDKRVVLEVALIRLCRPEMDKDNDAIVNRMENIEREIKKGVRVQQTVSAASESQATKPVVEKQKLPEEIADDVRRAAGVIDEVINSFDGSRTFLAVWWRETGHQVTTEGDGTALIIYFDELGAYETFLDETDVISDALKKKIGAEVKIEMKYNESDVPAAESHEGFTNADIQQVLGTDMDITTEE
ncbi:MAG: DNA polymerase III subunit gamma/tau [Lachnospiraceae bacterium]|nr:DNA polymerase III subunit gamma/tau [Lachnospiraceae bacterium]